VKEGEGRRKKGEERKKKGKEGRGKKKEEEEERTYSHSVPSTGWSLKKQLERKREQVKAMT